MANLSEGRLNWETIREQTTRLGRVGMWAPGSYVCKCSACERQFEGDKRAMNCLPCAVSRLSEIADRLTVEGLAGALAKTTCGDLPTADDRAIAQALLTYITGETHD